MHDTLGGGKSCDAASQASRGRLRGRLSAAWCGYSASHCASIASALGPSITPWAGPIRRGIPARFGGNRASIWGILCEGNGGDGGKLEVEEEDDSGLASPLAYAEPWFGLYRAGKVRRTNYG